MGVGYGRKETNSAWREINNGHTLHHTENGEKEDCEGEDGLVMVAHCEDRMKGEFCWRSILA